MTPEKDKRKKVPRTYDIYEDQIAWLDNSSLNKSKKIRELLDNFINDMDATVIQNLRDEIVKLNKFQFESHEQYAKEVTKLATDNQLLKEELVLMFQDVKERGENIRELMTTIESQKAVIVALGGKQ